MTIEQATELERTARAENAAATIAKLIVNGEEEIVSLEKKIRAIRAENQTWLDKDPADIEVQRTLTKYGY
jgi:hypothetical protein